jgi:phosphoenolpyruvate carboxykinase (ATP)
MREHNTHAWLVNTGWTGGSVSGDGQRMSIPHTRAIIDAIHSGALNDVPLVQDPIFGIGVPQSCPSVPTQVLTPKNAWRDPTAYEETAKKLAGLFKENFKKYSDHASAETIAAGPA